MALGALVLKERLGVTDRELVAQIAENPYLQYFLGLSAYHEDAPFHHSMLTHFRKRFRHGVLAKINDTIAQSALAPRNAEGTVAKEDGEDNPPSPKGKLIVDATCAPADIKYPTDINLLNEAREKTEAIIDHVHRFRTSPTKKPRTYRQKARTAYLRVAMAKQPGYKKIRRGIGKQLRYLRRNLTTITRMAEDGLLRHLPPHQYRQLLVIHELYRELYRQQHWMFATRNYRIADRIVSISQPHVRPIVRGKAGHPVEFGAKVSVSLVEGISFVDRISWDAYNESGDVVAQIEAYHRRFGHYPASVHADKIYRTCHNRRYCASKGIRLSGPPLGRPKKTTDHTAKQVKQEKQRLRNDENDRIAIEGKFGQGKRRFGLARIMAKLAVTSEVMIMISFLVMNLATVLSRVLSFWLYWWWTCSNISLRMARTVQEQPGNTGVRYSAC
jgi:hypothetical protein